MTSDSELLEAWRAGDERAGGTLFESYFPAIYRFFDRRVDGDVDDLVQRTFLACVEGRERIQTTVRAYLYGAARLVLHEHIRAKRKLANLDFGVSSLQEHGPSPSSATRLAEAQRSLHEAMRRIPIDLAIAVELSYWEGLRGPEIAQVLSVPEGTVRSRLRRALEKLREVLVEMEGELPTRLALDELHRWEQSE